MVAETGQGGGIIERHRAQTAVFRKIDGKMAANASAAAIADEHDLVAGIVRLMRRPAKPFAALNKCGLAFRLVCDLRVFQQLCESAKIAVQPTAEIRSCLIKHAASLAYFSRPVIALISADFSIERRWAT